jgi:hypothetical protein
MPFRPPTCVPPRQAEEQSVRAQQHYEQHGGDTGSYRDRLVYFYSRFNPSKLDQVMIRSIAPARVF